MGIGVGGRDRARMSTRRRQISSLSRHSSDSLCLPPTLTLPADPPSQRVNQVRRNLPTRIRRDTYLEAFFWGSGSLWYMIIAAGIPLPPHPTKTVRITNTSKAKPAGTVRYARALDV